MRQAIALGKAVLLLISVVRAAGAQQTPADQPTGGDPQPIATRQDLFTIPFHIPQSQDASRQPVEVQLHVSADRGATWQLYDRKPPHTRQFHFRAGRDGEYWFTSRTVDGAGRMRPTGPYRPELRVLVDTVAPSVQLSARVGAAGQIVTSWQLDDEHLVPESFVLEYRLTPSGDWNRVAVDRPEADATRAQATGAATWWPERVARQISVRASVHDLAGNSSVVHRQLTLGQTHEKVQPEQPDGERLEPGNRPDATHNVRTVPWPADRSVDVPLGHPAERQRGERDPIGGVADRSNEPRGPLSDNPSLAGRRLRPAHGPVSQPIGKQYVADPPRQARSGGPATTDGLPPGQRANMTQSKRFHLDYDVRSVGPSGVARVQLWGTTDGGRTWKSWGVDDDLRSPMPVEVPHEGLYGFRIVIEAGNGLTSRPPRPGDLAEVWVGVDQSRPTARITAAVYGKGNRVGQLDVHWEANDEHLAAYPVTLLFSARPGGPWTTIATGLPNTGRYGWQVDRRVPADIYLRLEVRDEAGNIGAVELERPIANDGLVPQGRILGVRGSEE